MVGCVAKISLSGLHSCMVSLGALMGGQMDLVLVFYVMLKLHGYLLSWWC